MGAPIYQNAAGMGGAMGQVNADIKKKKQETDSNSLEARTKKTAKEKAAKAAEKKRLNTKTKDTEAKTVKQGRLSRKEAVKTAKKTARSKRDAVLDKPTSYSDPTGTTNETTNIEGAIGKRKEARATKRQEMQDIRNEERGARRADRATRKIKRIGDRNDMTVGEATKVYNERQEALRGYKKEERGPNPANERKEAETKKTLEDQQLASERQKLKEQEKGFGLTGTNEENTESQKVVSGTSITNMLDGPTQQEASEDSQGISSFMMNSKNRRGH